MKKVLKTISEVAVSPAVVAAGQLTDRDLVAPDRYLLDMSARLGSHTQAILAASREVASGFIDIGRGLAALRDDKGVLSACGYSDIYDYSEKVFGFGRTSTKNFVSVFERFGNDVSYGGKYRDYSFTQLVELLPVKDNIDDYRPQMTVQAIRDQKLLAKVKAESRDFEDYLSRAFLLCGSFLSGAAFADSSKDSSGGKRSRKVCGSFLFKGVSYPVSFEPSFDPEDGFSCKDALRVGRSSVWLWESSKTPVGLSEKLSAVLRKELGKFDGKKTEGKASSVSVSVKVPAWRVWYDLPMDRKILSIRKENILAGIEKGEPAFFLADPSAFLRDSFVALTQRSCWLGKVGTKVLPFVIYGLVDHGVVKDLAMVGLTGDGKDLFTTTNLEGMVDVIMRFIEDNLIFSSDPKVVAEEEEK